VEHGVDDAPREIAADGPEQRRACRVLTAAGHDAGGQREGQHHDQSGDGFGQAFVRREISGRHDRCSSAQRLDAFRLEHRRIEDRHVERLVCLVFRCNAAFTSKCSAILRSVVRSNWVQSSRMAARAPLPLTTLSSAAWPVVTADSAPASAGIRMVIVMVPSPVARMSDPGYIVPGNSILSQKPLFYWVYGLLLSPAFP